MAEPIYLEGAEQFVAAKAAHRVVLRADGLRNNNYWAPAGRSSSSSALRDLRPGLGRTAAPPAAATVPPIGLPSEDLAVARATVAALERATGGLETKLRHLKDDLNFAVSVYNAQCMCLKDELARVTGGAPGGAN